MDYEYDPQRIVYFAATDARNKKIPFGIRALDRMRHMYVIGKTGMGKSTMLENLAIQDIQNGEGIAFIDPHGGSAEKLLEYVPEHRINDVVYFAPFDIENPLGFNVMEDVGFDKRHLVVAGLMSSFQRIWVDSWSARMEYILQNTLLALLEYPDTTLIDVNRMLINKEFRKKVVEYVTDPIVKRFWVEEFAGYTDRYTQDATPAIQNKIGQFASNPLVRNIIAQPKSTFDIREIMDTRKIFIVNLSKGRMGEQNADLLGSMLTTKIYLSAMSRAEETAAALAKLPPFYLYVDEFQSVVNDSFANILSEARKYKLSLTIAHQYIEQVEEEIRAAVFGNVGTTIAFRVGPFDAEVLKTVFEPTFYADDLVNLGFAQIYLSLMIDGIGSKPFSATTLGPVDSPPYNFVDKIIARSREQYARPRTEVEALIRSVDEKLPEGGFQKPANTNYPKKKNSSNSQQSAKTPSSSSDARRTESKSEPHTSSGTNQRNSSGNSNRLNTQSDIQSAPKEEAKHDTVAAPRERHNSQTHERKPQPASKPLQPISQKRPQESKDDTAARTNLRAALSAITPVAAAHKTPTAPVFTSSQSQRDTQPHRETRAPVQQPQSHRDRESSRATEPSAQQSQQQSTFESKKEIPRDILDKLLNED